MRIRLYIVQIRCSALHHWCPFVQLWCCPLWQVSDFTCHNCSRAQSPSFGGSGRVRLGIKEEWSVSASSDEDHSTQHLEDYNW